MPETIPEHSELDAETEPEWPELPQEHVQDLHSPLAHIGHVPSLPNLPSLSTAISNIPSHLHGFPSAAAITAPIVAALHPTHSATLSRKPTRQRSRASSNADHTPYPLTPRLLPVWVVENSAQSGGENISSSVPGTKARGILQPPSPGYTKLMHTYPANGGQVPVLKLQNQVSYPKFRADKFLEGYIDPPELYGDQSRWTSFLSATSRPELYSKTFEITTEDLNRQTDLSGSWLGENEENNTTPARGSKRSRLFKGTETQEKARNGRLTVSSARYFVSEESRKTWKPRLNFILLNNPYVPLTLRTIIFILSIAALALGCEVYTHSRSAFPISIPQQPSTIMALTVQSTALVYLVYITYDEYSGKPLGLREPKAKMRLIMLDLLFIIFSSANLSLCFNTLLDDAWVCQVSTENKGFYAYNGAICRRQRGLASFLFLILVAWVCTFTISIFRLVERVSG